MEIPNIEAVRYQVGTLFPGIVTFSLLTMTVPTSVLKSGAVTNLSLLLNNPFVVGTVFIAASYIVGAFSVALSRILIKFISDRHIRWRVLRHYHSTQFQGKDRKEITTKFRNAYQQALKGKNTYKAMEVRHRRERARLIRTSLIPAWSFAVLLCNGRPWWMVSALIISVYCIIIILFASAEMSVYLESISGVDEVL